MNLLLRPLENYNDPECYYKHNNSFDWNFLLHIYYYETGIPGVGKWRINQLKDANLIRRYFF